MCYDISFTAKLKDLSNYFPELVESPQLSFDFGSDHIIANKMVIRRIVPFILTALV